MVSSKIKKLAENRKVLFLLFAVFFFAMANGFSLLGEYAVNEEDYRKWFVLGMIPAGLLMIFAGILAVRAYRKLEKPIKLQPWIAAMLAALQVYTVSETCMRTVVFKIYPIYFLMGYAMYAVPFLLGVAIFKKPKIWLCVMEVAFTFYGVAQFYIQKFRGSPIKFTDLMNIGSALEVTEEYKLTAEFAVISAAVQLGLMLFLLIRCELVTEGWKPRVISVGSSVVAAVLFVVITNYTYNWGIKNRVICLNFSAAEETRTSRSVGNLLMFYYDGIFNRVQEPEDYSTEKAEGIIDAYPTNTETEEKPIIVAILNESFSDFSHIAEFNTDGDYLPTWHGLTENTVKGYVTVSAYGGYPCNSEYEYLTGNSMYFLPLGSAAYTNYFHEKQDSIVSTLNDLDFETVAVTPCRRGLWEISRVYPLLGFDTMYFEDNIDLTSDLKYNRQPADEVVFDKVVELAKKRDKSKGTFYWVTTMQNHAPYVVDVDGGVKLTDIKDTEAERYLNSIKLSDEGVGKMIEKFKNFDEHVIVVMFGDHYPHIASFAEELYDGPLADLNVEDYSRIHQTPFFIWSNKPMESKFIDDISLNYLAIETMKAADLPLSPVMQELEHIRESLPIVSGFGYKTADGEWHQSGDEDNSYKSILEEYRTVQYYRMFDEDRRILKN